VPNHLVSVHKLHGFVNLKTKLNFTCRFCQCSDDSPKSGGTLRWFLVTVIAYLIGKHPKILSPATEKEVISKQYKSPADGEGHLL
jgi:hypothetical protein